MAITHWTAQQKAALIRAVRSGELVREAILVEHWISPEEWAAWERDYDSAGVPGLRSTRYQIYRGRSPGQRPRGRPRRKAQAVIAAAIAAFALASPGSAKAQSIVSTENLCRDPEVAGDLMKEFNHLKWEDGRQVVDIEHLVTLANRNNGKSCHGIWDLEDGRQIEGTLTLRLNVAGDPIVHWHEETLPTVSFTKPIVPTFTNPSAPMVITSSFYDGAHDRMAWETWFNGLTGEEHDGAYFWAAQRSLPVPANCTRLGGEGTLGCLEAKRRLDQTDVRRKTDPEYRAGWNSIHSN